MPGELILQYQSSDPFFLSQCLNVTVNIESLALNMHGFYVKVNGFSYITINQNISSAFHRFVCAHELAHAVLHSSLNYYILTEQTLFNPNKLERQANLWAIRLLGYGHHLHEGETVKNFYRRIGVPIGLAELVPHEWAPVVS